MQWSQRNQFVQLCQDLAGYDRWLGIPCPTMNHTVADTEHSCATVPGAKPGSQNIEGRAAIRHPIIQVVLCEDSAVSVLGGESRRRPDALNLTSGLQSPFLRVWPPVYAEFQAR